MAQKHLGISGLLDAEDVDVDKPDEKSVITYVSSFYHTFAKMKNEAVGGKRVGKIIGFMIEIDKMIASYESQVEEMLHWIQKKIKEHYDFVFPNSLDAIKSLMLTFNKGYMTIEKPPKYKQKSILTAHFYNINMKLNAQGHPKYAPADGKTIHDLETQWSRLETAEHERDSALKKELNRQEQLEQLYAKFDKKAKLREDWLSEMAHILTSSTLVTSQIDATFRKQEAIGTDMQARADRFSRLDQLAKNLINEDYFFKETVRKRNQQIQLTYNNLLEQYEKRKATLSTFQELELLFQEMQSLNNEMIELESSFQSKEYGEYLLAVEDLLTKHALLESQKAGISQHLKSINRRAQQFTRPLSIAGTPNSDNPSNLASSESRLVKEKLDALNKAFELINVLSDVRRKYLEERRQLHKFMEEAEEESLWLQEKLQSVKSTEAGHDLNSTQLLITKHEQIEDELKFRKPHCDQIVQSGEQLIASKCYNSKENEKLKSKFELLKTQFESLREAAKNRRSLLEDSFSSQQYFADANDADSWMKDKMALVSSVDNSMDDEASSQAAFQRHARVQEEIRAYEPEIRRLEEITNVLVGKRRFSSIPADMRQKFMKNQQKRNALIGTTENSEMSDDLDDTLDEETTANLSSDTLESKGADSCLDDQEPETFTREVQCVKALYAYQSKTFNLQRGEILELKEKSNEEWWLVENNIGKEGFAPATYLRELGLQTIVKQGERIVKKTVVAADAANALIMMSQNNTKKKKTNLRRKTTSIQPRQLQHLSTELLQKRQVEINFFYGQLFNEAIEKRKLLESSITYYKWLRKYDELDKWLREKQQHLSIDKEEAGNSLLENPDAAKRRYQAFNTDFLANQNEFADLERLADDLKKSSNFPEKASLKNIQQKQTEINVQWLKLIELKKYWDNSVKAIECIDKFNTSYADVNDLLEEKLSNGAKSADESAAIDNVSSTDVVKSVRALQAKQDKLEREILTIEANVNELRKTAEQVCKYFPQEKKNVQRKLEAVDELWFRLRDDVKTRKAKLDEKHGLQRFENEVNDFNSTCNRIRASLNELEKPHDLKQCEEMQKKFNELEQEFNNEITFKFNELKQLSQKQLAKRGVIGSVDKINSQLSQVATERTHMAVAIDDKRKYLDDYQKYLKFKQDANNFELLMQDQEAYLQYEDLGSSLTNVEALQKRHDEFLAKLMAQDEKMKLLNDQFAKLTAYGNSKHFAEQEIDLVLKNLTSKRDSLKRIALDRKQKLKQSKEFFEFRNQCDDLNSWLNERRRKCATINLDDLTSSVLIEKYSTKHAGLEKELNANRIRLETLKLDAANQFKNESLISELEENWLKLELETKTRGKRLAETKSSVSLTSSLNDIDTRMKNLEQSLNTTYNLNDLRSVKEALKKNNDLKKQICVELDLVTDLTKSDSKLLTYITDKASIETAVKEYVNKFKALNPLLEQRQKELETNLVLQQLIFDIDEELKWIDQSKRQIEIMFSVMPKSLFEAQSLTKRQAELERSIQVNHKPNIEKLVEQSVVLLKESMLVEQPSAQELKNKIQKLETQWIELAKLNAAKQFILNDCLNEQENLEQLAQVSLGLAEKQPLLAHIQQEIPLLKDETVLSKNSAKLSQLELDLNGYQLVINDLNKAINQSSQKASANVERKLEETSAQLKEMQQQIEDNKQKLLTKNSAIEFEREATDLIQWLNEKRQKAQSEDYGQDYEHLILIQAKFNALKDEIRVFEEPRLERIRKLSTELLNLKSPDSKQIRKRWDEIKVLRDILDQEIQHRDAILNSAAEIHCFNKDVQDLVRRISDKELAFSTDLGRDFQSCESLRRKHEIFIEELTALKVQLQDLNKQSEVLRQRHPGDTAESVAAETDDLIDQFRSLWLKTEKRTKELKQSSDYFRFINYVRDVNEWIDQIDKSLNAPLQLNDLFTVTGQKQEHESLSFEMTQRDDMFKELDDMCIQLTKQNHPNKRDILSLTNKAMTSRENLFRLWKLKSELLDSQFDCHMFYRECSQLIGQLNSQETLLNNSINESSLQLNQQIILSVDDLEMQMKSHQNLEKKIEKQTVDKGNELERLGAQLIEREVKRLESDEDEFKISELIRLEHQLAQLLKKQNDVTELCHKRVKQLSEMIRFFKLCRDIDEFEVWIDDRIRFANSLKLSSNLVLSDKVKLFQVRV
jgi:spectrin beta